MEIAGTRVSHGGLGPLIVGNDGDAQSTIGACTNHLLLSSSTDEIAGGADQDKPADNHQCVGDPITGGDAGSNVSGGDTSVQHGRVKIVGIWIGGDCTWRVASVA